MLAQNFKTAQELGIEEPLYRALQTVLKRLETNDLIHDTRYNTTLPNAFCMNIDKCASKCGTVACLAGWASIEMGVRVSDVIHNECLDRLFYPGDNYDYDAITTEMAAIALRNYFTTGIIDWSHAPRYGDAEE
jgi:hypothetical protein